MHGTSLNPFPQLSDKRTVRGGMGHRPGTETNRTRNVEDGATPDGSQSTPVVVRHSRSVRSVPGPPPGTVRGGGGEGGATSIKTVGGDCPKLCERISIVRSLGPISLQSSSAKLHSKTHRYLSTQTLNNHALCGGRSDTPPTMYLYPYPGPAFAKALYWPTETRDNQFRDIPTSNPGDTVEPPPPSHPCGVPGGSRALEAETKEQPSPARAMPVTMSLCPVNVRTTSPGTGG